MHLRISGALQTTIFPVPARSQASHLDGGVSATRAWSLQRSDSWRLWHFWSTEIVLHISQELENTAATLAAMEVSEATLKDAKNEFQGHKASHKRWGPSLEGV